MRQEKTSLCSIYNVFFSDLCCRCSVNDGYSNPTGMIKSSMEKIGLRLFILGNACDFAICRVFFVCFFFDQEKKVFLDRLKKHLLS